MIRALLDGRKTMTRRLASREIINQHRGFDFPPGHRKNDWVPTPWRKLKIGDRLWVRENWCVSATHDKKKPSDLAPRSMTVMFEAGGSIANINTKGDWRPDDHPKVGETPDWAGKPRPSIYLPRWASRLMLVVTATKTEPLQNISEADAMAEGVDRAAAGTEQRNVGQVTIYTFRTGFVRLWGELHGTDSWLNNPEVVAPTFTVHKQNIDSIAA